MRSMSFVPTSVLCWMLAVPAAIAAQPGAPSVIQRVTLDPATGVLTVAGTGLGGDLRVAVEGQPVSVLPGATDTQLQVQAPEPMLVAPGTYRLAIVNAQGTVGDSFVVAVDTAHASVGTTASSASTKAAGSGRVSTDRLARRTTAAMTPTTGRVSPSLSETGFNTAVGVGALAANTSGIENTAAGAQALAANTTGSRNSAVGDNTLRWNTSGGNNTAIGQAALYFNTTGKVNTALGFSALFQNTTASYNTAMGGYALSQNSTGDRNVATGYTALAVNTIGSAKHGRRVRGVAAQHDGLVQHGHWHLRPVGQHHGQ